MSEMESTPVLCENEEGAVDMFDATPVQVDDADEVTPHPQCIPISFL